MPDREGTPDEMTPRAPDWNRGQTAPLRRVDEGGWPVANGTAAQPAWPADTTATPGAYPHVTPRQADPNPGQGHYSQAAQQSARAGAGKRPNQGRRPVGLRNRDVLRWTVRGAGLVAVAVVSGALWLAIKPDPPPPQPVNPGKFTFTQQWMDRQPSCSAHSIDQIKTFFSRHPCNGMVRTLQSSTAPDGTRVLTSVITVRMRDPATAERLQKLTHHNATGNVNDLVQDGIAKIPGGPTEMPDYGYASAVRGTDVVLAESNFYGPDRGDDPQLTQVSQDALRLAADRV